MAISLEINVIMLDEKSVPKPFLRWAGGKQWLIRDIFSYLPKKFNSYHEPFLGGGSVFVHLKGQGLINGESILSDLNRDLINSYVTVRDDVETLIKRLRTFKNEEAFYYDVRSKKPQSDVGRAAQFIFLNRTSYNGIYRVNLLGEYNVPFGRKNYLQLFDFDNLTSLSELFDGSHFHQQDFYSSLDFISKGDLVFLDPPYTVAHEHNGFVKYNQKIFQWADQERLRDYIEILKKRKAHFILTNAAHQSIEKLYRGVGKKFVLTRNSVIGGKFAKRDRYREFLFVS
jgi:DNA adenine methylase